jgi:hypothetical protein
MRCPDCNKFVSLDTSQEPEVDLDVDETTGEVTGTVRIVNTCAECGTEMTEATFDVDVEFDGAEAHIKDHAGDDMVLEDLDKHELEMEDFAPDRDERYEGKGRGTKTFYRTEGTITVKCSCGMSWSQPWSDEIQASHMDEMN